MKTLFNPDRSQCNKKAPIVVSKDTKNPVKHILKNNSNSDIFQWHIDGDIEKGTTENKCDFLLEVHKTSSVIFFPIELKGKSELDKALKQIESTIVKYHLDKKGVYSLFPRIIMKSVSTHNLKGTTYRNFKKNYPNLKIESNLLEDNV